MLALAAALLAWTLAGPASASDLRPADCSAAVLRLVGSDLVCRTKVRARADKRSERLESERPATRCPQKLAQKALRVAERIPGCLSPGSVAAVASSAATEAVGEVAGRLQFYCASSDLSCQAWFALNALAGRGPATLKCTAQRRKASGGHARCLLRASARALEQGRAPLLDRCEARYQRRWARLAGRNRSCLANVHVEEVDALVHAGVDPLLPSDAAAP